MKILPLVLTCLFISSCATDYSNSAIYPTRKLDDIQRISDTVNNPFEHYPKPEHYSICYGHTCAHFASISLNDSKWTFVKSLFNPIDNSSQKERESIKKAIALLEQYSGEQAGTQNDRAKNDMSKGTRGQLDCIDEATNTTVYLRLLANAGLLQFHTQASRTSRGGLIAPHNTATLIDNTTQTRYAVDSWFDENGQAPHIVALTLWKQGWEPTEK